MFFRSRNLLLIGGFSTIILIMIITALVSFQKTRSIANLTNQIFNHPLAVSNAVLETDAAIISMHRYMKDVALAKNKQDLNLAISKVNASEKLVYKNFDIIIDRFLGDKTQIMAAKKAFDDWRKIRAEVIVLTQIKKFDQAAEITKGKGAIHVELLAKHMAGLVNFAREKAHEFHTKSNNEFQNFKHIIMGLLLGAVLACGVVAAFVIIKIKQTDQNLIKAQRALKKANTNLEQRVEERTHELFKESIDRKFAEKALNRFFDQPINLNIIADLEGQIIRTNTAWKDILGYNQRELAKTSIMDFIHPDDLEKTDHEFNLLNSGRMLASFENRCRHKNGQYRVLEWSATALLDDNTIYGVANDITVRKQAEAQIRQAKQAAEQANQAKSEFLASMSHDLRTPLNAILGFSDMMRTETFGKLGSNHYLEYANDIFNSGSLLVSLINDILDLSKVESGKYELVEENLDLNDLVHTSFRQLEAMASACSQSLICHLSFDNIVLYCDERALIQVLNNLISNAIKFTPDGGTITLEGYLDVQNQIILKVTDNGIGMSKIGIEKALQPFEQAGSKLSKRYQGTGLGLHLCLNFMALFGGSLDVESNVDRGTAIILTFPAQRTVRVS